MPDDAIHYRGCRITDRPRRPRYGTSGRTINVTQRKGKYALNVILKEFPYDPQSEGAKDRAISYAKAFIDGLRDTQEEG